MRKVHDGIWLVLVIVIMDVVISKLIERANPAVEPSYPPGAPQLEFYKSRHPHPTTRPTAEDVAEFYDRHHRLKTR